MEKYINPWALEVLSKHPEISICDQYQYVKDNYAFYKSWWEGQNVHFKGDQADKLGELLAAHIERVMNKN